MSGEARGFILIMVTLAFLSSLLVGLWILNPLSDSSVNYTGISHKAQVINLKIISKQLILNSLSVTALLIACVQGFFQGLTAPYNQLYTSFHLSIL